MKQEIKSIYNRMMYRIWGPMIQRALERSEEAGRETERYLWITKTKDLENDLKQLQIKHEREVGQIVNKRISGLNYSVNPDDVFTVIQDRSGKTSGAMLGEERLNGAQIRELKQEVLFIKQSKLWNIFTHTLRKHAQDIMFTKSQSFDDMRGGKMLLYSIDVEERILNAIETIDLPTPGAV